MELKKQIEQQQVQFELLANQASSLIQGRRSRVGATSAINGQLIVLDEKLSASNREVLFQIEYISMSYLVVQSILGFQLCNYRRMDRNHEKQTSMI